MDNLINFGNLLDKAAPTEQSTNSSGTSDKDSIGIQPEGLVPDLDLSKHTTGSWPSSKNVSQ